MFILDYGNLYLEQIKGEFLPMPFMTERKKQLLKVLILATALIPIYVIFMAIFPGLVGISVFTSIYSAMMLGIWVLYYFDAFDKSPAIKQTNGKLALNNEETLKPN